ncbi:ankyrin [Penicillium malachiteum]|nr:ankyrin [Penicillium malachiteum]
MSWDFGVGDFLELLEKANNLRKRFINAPTQFQAIIAEFQRVFIVLDALDECHMADGSRDMLLDQLFVLQSKHTLGILATSRENPEISSQFAGCPSLMIRANGSDIERFLRGQMGMLPNFVRNKPELQQEIVDKITKAVDGMYVNLEISSTPPRFPQREDIAETTPKRTRQSLDSRAAKEVLAWIICATRPLTPIELQHALAIESDESYVDEENIPDINDLVSICAGLVTIDEQSTVIRLAHYTTQEYFEDDLDGLFPGAHSLLGAPCIICLSFEDFESVPVSLEAIISDRWTNQPLYSYCALNVGYHVQKGDVPLDWILQFLDDTSKVAACAQVIFLERKPNMVSQWMEINGFHLAVYLGLYDAAKVLIEDGYSVEATDSVLRTSISWLAEAGSDEGVKFMLSQGADPDHMDTNGQAALSYAALTGREKVFHVLKHSGCQLEPKNGQGQTPLLYAIWGGHKRIVQLLLKERVDANRKDGNGQTPLLHVVQQVFENHPRGSSRMRIVELLLHNGVDPSCQDKTGQSPLSYAVQGGNIDLVQILLEAGSSVECEDLQGRTPLLCAVALGSEQMVKILLAWGANPECKDHNGKALLSSSGALGHESLVEILLYGGADVNSKDDGFGKTALSYAAWNGFKSVVDLVLEYGADPNCTDNQGWNPLSWAAEYGHVEIVRVLLHRSAESAVNEDIYWRTPLAWAALRGHQDVVDLLLATDPCADDMEVKDLLPRVDPERVEILEGLPKSFKIEE